MAMGLYLRGLTPDRRNIIGRWPEQMAELKQLHDLSEVEGWAPEYWSPAPYWKSTGSWYNGTLASFNESFLDEFCDSVVQDVKYLNDSGLSITWWGLQNEPNFATANVTVEEACGKRSEMDSQVQVSSTGKPNTYSECSYTQCNYYQVVELIFVWFVLIQRMISDYLQFVCLGFQSLCT